MGSTYREFWFSLVLKTDGSFTDSGLEMGGLTHYDATGAA